MWIGFLLGVAITWTAFGVAFWALLLEERAERSERVLAMTRMLDAEQEVIDIYVSDVWTFSSTSRSELKATMTDWEIAAKSLGYDTDGRHRDVRGW